ncbi:hypothetical protein A2U01_0086498, partial [Trifolium medium]|nr:hypothetical protein [Trifolium medium]
MSISVNDAVLQTLPWEEALSTLSGFFH